MCDFGSAISIEIGGAPDSQVDNSAAGSGAVYVLARAGTSWSHAAYLKAWRITGEASFGS